MNVSEIDFANPQDGWAVAGNGVTYTLLRTADGGQSWVNARATVAAGGVATS